MATPGAATNGKPTTTPTGETYRAGAAAQYGVMSYPTTILIDRAGNVVGTFNATDASAVEQIEMLLGVPGSTPSRSN